MNVVMVKEHRAPNRHTWLLLYLVSTLLPCNWNVDRLSHNYYKEEGGFGGLPGFLNYLVKTKYVSIGNGSSFLFYLL